MEENVEGFSKEKTSKIKFHVVAIICIILFAIAIAPKTLQNDTFYTVKIGEYISQNGISNLTEDPFSWIDLPYTFPHWLYDFMMFKIYNLFHYRQTAYEINPVRNTPKPFGYFHHVHYKSSQIPASHFSWETLDPLPSLYNFQ